MYAEWSKLCVCPKLSPNAFKRKYETLSWPGSTQKFLGYPSCTLPCSCFPSSHCYIFTDIHRVGGFSIISFVQNICPPPPSRFLKNFAKKSLPSHHLLSSRGCWSLDFCIPLWGSEQTLKHCLCSHAKAVAFSPTILIIVEKKGWVNKAFGKSVLSFSWGGVNQWPQSLENFAGQFPLTALQGLYHFNWSINPHAQLLASGWSPRTERSQFQPSLLCLVTTVSSFSRFS